MFKIKKKLEKFVVNKVMDTMDSALNIAETVRDHPLADRIGQIVKEKTVKKEDKSQEAVPEESGYIHLTNINVEEQAEQVQAQSSMFASQMPSVEDEPEDTIPEKFEYVRLTNINVEEQPKQEQNQSSVSVPQMSSVPPMPEMSGIPPMPGAIPQVSYMIGVNGLQVGPCDWNQLQQMVQQGQLTQQSYVWKQGMPQWQLAGEVMELAPLFQGSTPDIPPMPHM